MKRKEGSSPFANRLPSVTPNGVTTSAHPPRLGVSKLFGRLRLCLAISFILFSGYMCMTPFVVRKIAQFTPRIAGIIKAKWHGINVPIVVEHPKCGRTWFKCITGSLLGLEMGELEIDTANVKQAVTYAENHAVWKHGRASFDAQSTPSMVETTQELSNIYRHWTGLLLVRDPRDTIVSSFYQIKYRQNKNHIIPDDSVLEEYIYYERASFKTYISFLNEWAGFFTDATASANWRVVRYEDLRADGDSSMITLRGISELLQLKLSDEQIRAAADRCSFQRMKKEAEGQGGVLGSTRKDPAAEAGPDGAKKDNSAKVRNGKVGGYTAELSPEHVACLNVYMCEHLSAAAIRHFKYTGDCEGKACSKW